MKNILLIVGWLFFHAVLATQTAMADDELSYFAGDYVVTDFEWIPSRLVLNKSGRFDWTSFYLGNYHVSGRWSFNDNKIKLLAKVMDDQPIYQLSAQDGISLQNKKNLVAVYVVGPDMNGISGNSAIFEDAKGWQIHGKEEGAYSGLIGVKTLSEWGPWKRVALKRTGSSRKWKWLPVNDIARDHGVMTVVLKNSNEVAPVFKEIVLSLEIGEHNELILNMPRRELNAGIPVEAFSSIPYRRQEKPINDVKLVGVYKSASRSSKLWLNADHSAVFLSESNYLKGHWGVKGGFIRFATDLPDKPPAYRLMREDEVKIKKAASNRELIVAVGVPKVSGVSDIEVQFEAHGKILGRAVSNRSGDAIIIWSGAATNWTRVALRRSGSHDPWSLIEIPPDFREKRMICVAINDMKLLKSSMKEFFIGQSLGGELILRDPVSESSVYYAKELGEK